MEASDPMDFAYYDFVLTVPNEWRIITEKKSEYGRGQIAFLPPKDDKFSVDLLWENLDVYKSKGATVEAFIDNYFENLRKNRNIVDLETYKGELTKWEGHEMLYHEFKYTFKQMMRRGFTQHVVGIAIYDTHSNRFIISYAKIDPKKEAYENTARDIIRTFHCNCSESAPPTAPPAPNAAPSEAPQ